MKTKLPSLLLVFCVVIGVTASALADEPASKIPQTALVAELKNLDPRAERHIPIGIINTRDALKTFVEAEGVFSPGVGSYGVYYWLYDKADERLFAPTMDDVEAKCGLDEQGRLVPWAQWNAGAVQVRSELCQTVQKTPAGDSHVVASRIRLRNTGDAEQSVFFYAALRSLGPAGWPVHSISASREGDALLVGEHPAIVSTNGEPVAGVAATDVVGELAARGRLPSDAKATSEAGDCSGALRFSLTLAPGQEETLTLVYPVLPGRRISGHRWVSLPGQNARVDAAGFDPDVGDVLLADPGLGFYRQLDVATLFREAANYWTKHLGSMHGRLPDDRWDRGLRAMLSHAAMCLNDDAPDVAVINYNVYNRDGMYIANMMQKAGLHSWSERIIDYFLAHPFNGRPFPEADNPGQILWSAAEHWRVTRDREWLKRVYPKLRQLTEMVVYYRTTAGPHWVDLSSLQFGETLPSGQRHELKPGRCDGIHPEYTEAFDIAGLRGAALLAGALDLDSDAQRWTDVAKQLFHEYGQKFEKQLSKKYGSYSVLWPCRLYPLNEGPAYEQFRNTGAQPISHWRYFAPATAHQSLLAGNRDAGWKTVEAYLDHPQMRDWFAMDEGGLSGSGGWHHLKTNWKCDREKPGRNGSVAMPHGWAIAEVWLLMRDSLLLEDGDTLLLLAGVPSNWFRHPSGMRIANFATWFGKCRFSYQRNRSGATLELNGAAPPGGFVLCLPPELRATASAAGQVLTVRANGQCPIPADAKKVVLSF